MKQPQSEPPERDEEGRHANYSSAEEEAAQYKHNAAEYREFNDGTLSPPPSDLTAYWSDAYAAAWEAHSLPEHGDEDDEVCGVHSAEYAHFASKLDDGKLVLRKGDLCTPKRWKALGFFLAHNNEVHSIRFHGVDLRADFYPMRQCFVRHSLAHQLQRMKKRENEESLLQGDSYATTDLESLSSSSQSSDSPSPANSASSPCNSPQPPAVGCSLRSEWTGGWGVDITSLEVARRRRELAKNNSLRHVTFVDNCLGIEESKQSKAEEGQQSGHSAKKCDSRSSPLENVLSMLLFCELLESCNIWRQCLNDEQAVKIADELLLKHPSLRKLSLRWNGVTTAGAQRIERILHKMATNVQEAEGKEVGGAQFEELDLAFNRIDPASCPELFSSPYKVSPNVASTPPSVQLAPPPSGSHSLVSTASSIAASLRAPQPAVSATVSSSPSSSASFQTKSVPTYRVNLRSQMPHSALMLSHFLRLTSAAVQTVCSSGSAATALYNVTRIVQPVTPVHLVEQLRTVKTSA